jgi:hypothetical protein
MSQLVGLRQFPLLLDGIFVLITAIGKHFIHVKAVCLCWCAGFIVATPMVRKQLPSLRAQFLWFHTKHSMGVLIGFVELGIII